MRGDTRMSSVGASAREPPSHERWPSSRLLICDEATSSLDVMAQHQIVELLRTLKQANRLSILFISHNLALVQSFCDRVLVMHEGKIVEEGTPDQVIRSPQSDYTKRMVEAAF